MLADVLRRAVRRARDGPAAAGPFFAAVAEGRVEDVIAALDSGAVDVNRTDGVTGKLSLSQVTAAAVGSVRVSTCCFPASAYGFVRAA
jgi:hypothetical protein